LTSSISLSIFICFSFFFQAEDGIRDRNVTGVQTCALPISNLTIPDFVAGLVPKPTSIRRRFVAPFGTIFSASTASDTTTTTTGRSEERRVGKEGKSRRAGDQKKKKKKKADKKREKNTKGNK